MRASSLAAAWGSTDAGRRATGLVDEELADGPREALVPAEVRHPHVARGPDREARLHPPPADAPHRMARRPVERSVVFGDLALDRPANAVDGRSRRGSPRVLPGRCRATTPPCRPGGPGRGRPGATRPADRMVVRQRVPASRSIAWPGQLGPERRRSPSIRAAGISRSPVGSTRKFVRSGPSAVSSRSNRIPAAARLSAKPGSSCPAARYPTRDDPSTRAARPGHRRGRSATP